MESFDSFCAGLLETVFQRISSSHCLCFNWALGVDWVWWASATVAAFGNLFQLPTAAPSSQSQTAVGGWWPASAGRCRAIGSGTSPKKSTRSEIEAKAVVG